MDDLPPPPYTPHDPSMGGGEVPTSEVGPGQPFQPTLRGGYTRPSLPSEESHLSSAATYFDDRHPHLQNSYTGLNLIEHNVMIGPETTKEDVHYPLPIETYIDRDVTSLDWSTYVNYLFPAQDEPVNEKPRREKDSRPRSFGDEDTSERRKQIQAVVTEWNENFFNPRLIHINVDFIRRRSSSSSRSTVRATSTIGVSPSQTSLGGDFVPPKFAYSPKPSDRLQHSRRSHSVSSISSSSFSSSSSSSSSSVDSVKSKDLEGADINGIRSALLAFRLDTSTKHHLRASVRQLRDEFRSQRRDLSFRERKEVNKESKDQRRDVKKEIKTVIKEIKATRKADRKLRKAERKSRRESKRAESRGQHHVHRAHKKSLRKQERAEEKVLRAQEKGIQAQERAAEKAAKARERVAEGYGRAREAQARETAAMADARERAASTRAGGWGRETARGGGGWGDAGREKAWAAEARAQETARGCSSRNWGSDAVARAHEAARNASNQDWGSYGRERAKEAELTARNASGQGWGRYGRERAREAEQRARDIARGPGERFDGDGEQESGVLD